MVCDNETGEKLNKMLEDFQASDYVLHGVGEGEVAVAITVDSEPADHDWVLINLQAEIPTWFSRFERVMEIIYQQPEYEQAKRDNFKFYKERGYPLSFHDLSEKFKP